MVFWAVPLVEGKKRAKSLCLVRVMLAANPKTVLTLRARAEVVAARLVLRRVYQEPLVEPVAQGMTFQRLSVGLHCSSLAAEAGLVR
jgi:hypothetical protein